MPVAASAQHHPRYWGPRTANVDFCEEDYEITQYIAEWWNTWSNATFIILALYGLVSSRSLELRFKLCYLSMVILGIGSTMFHATLRIEEQMYDEVPMVIVLTIFIYSLFSSHTKVGAPPRWGLLATLFSICLGLWYAYFVVDLSIVFQTGYLIQAVVFYTSFWYLFTQFRSSNYAKKSASAASIQSMEYGLWLILRASIPALTVWAIDMFRCEYVIAVREFFNSEPINVLLQLHLWWHILSAMAAYNSVVSLRYFRMMHLGTADNIQLKSTAGIMLRLVESPKAKLT
ncbi:alkaline phytoceramidase [Ramicandelaber brevisporus]|nr:alkaline phytoceramidase [Ramicandelaber brevisporus]